MKAGFDFEISRIAGRDLLTESSENN